MKKDLIKVMQDTSIEGETRPLTLNKKWCVDLREHSWHWLISDSSHHPIICEWLNGQWHNVAGVLTPAQMYEYGRRWHSQVKIPKKLRK